MYERFTREARQVVVQAQDEVRALGHDHAGPEHLLLALAHIDTWVKDLLVGRGITHERLRGELLAGPGLAGPSVALGQEWRRVLEAASREADRLGRTTVGAEHLLLGVLDQGGDALGCLHELGQQPEELRKAVLSVGPGHDPDEPGPLSGAEVEAFLSEVEQAAASGAKIWSGSTFPELTRLVPLPRCPSCETSLPGNLSHHRLTAGPELTVDVVACSVCGHTLSVTPYSR